MSGPKLSLEQAQELTTEQRLDRLERELVELREGVDLAIDYSRAIALEFISAERLAILEARAKERDERLRT